MKILQIKIDGFGRWINADLNVNPPLQVFYGPNEAGKSTLVEFIKSVLFGVQNALGKNKFKQYTPKQTDAYGGSLLVEVDGQRYWIHRSGKQHGGKVEITHEDGRNTRTSLEQLLGPLNRDLVENIFVFNQSELARIDDLTADQLRQDLQQVGAVGSVHWQDLKTALDKQTTELYKKRGRKPVLNQQLKKVATLEEQVAAAQGKNDEYRDVIHQLAATAEEQHRVDRQLATARQQRAILADEQRLWPVYQQWQTAQAKQQDLKQLSDQDLTDAQQLATAIPEKQRQVDQAKQDLQGTDQRISELKTQELVDYQQQWQGVNDPTSKIRQLQVEQLSHDQKQAAATQAREQLSDIQRRLKQDNLPQPLTTGQREQLAQLQQPVAQRPVQRQFNPAALVSGAIGIIVLLAGLAMKAGWLDLIGLLLIVVAGVLFARKQQQLTADRRRTDDQERQRQHDLVVFGEQHGLSNFAQDQWLAIQADLATAGNAMGIVNQYNEEDDRLNQQRQEWGRRFPLINATQPADFWQRLLDYLSTSQQKLQQLSELNQRRARQMAAVQTLQGQLANQQASLTAIYQHVGATDAASFQQYLQRRTAVQTEAATKSATESQISPDMRQRLAKYHDSQELADQLAQVTVSVSELQQQQTDLAKREEQLRIQKQNLVKDGSTTELEQRLANAREGARQINRQWLTLMLASQWIDRALRLASADRYPQIIEKAEEYFAILTADRYQTISFTDKTIHVAGPAGRQFEVGELSTGTAEQLYVALRLGFVSVMSDTVNFPLIIDDGFVNFDNDRKSRVMDLLRQVAKTNQVIYFTADNRILTNGQLPVEQLGGAQSND